MTITLNGSKEKPKKKGLRPKSKAKMTGNLTVKKDKEGAK